MNRDEIAAKIAELEKKDSNRQNAGDIIATYKR